MADREPTNVWGATQSGGERRLFPGAAFRFHASAGGRVALRNSVLGTMGAIIVMGSAPRPPGMFRPLALGVASVEASSLSLWVFALAALGLARQAAPQLAAGHAGWIRSLPMREATRRRSLVGALVLAQAPLIVFLVSAIAVVLVSPGAQLSPVKLASCVLIFVGAAMVAVPSGRRLAVVLASLATIGAAATATVVGLIASLAALVLADRLSGIPTSARRRPPAPLGTVAALLPYRIAWRALGWRALGALGPSILPVGFAWLMCDNNGMTGDEAATVMRTAGTIGVSVALSGLAATLQLNRPPWAWARSLPNSAMQRVRQDAIVLLVPLVPIWIAVGAVHMLAGAAVAAVSVPLALVATAAMRRAGARITGATGEVVVMGVVASILVSRSWALTLACVAMTPLALHLAARRERALVATQWSERHHSIDGDAMAWAAR